MASGGGKRPTSYEPNDNPEPNITPKPNITSKPNMTPKPNITPKHNISERSRPTLGWTLNLHLRLSDPLIMKRPGLM